MASHIQRRKFLAAVGGAAAAWPLAARAQQPMPVVGFLHPLSVHAVGYQLRAFHQGLKEAGFVDGENVAIEYRWADNQNDRLALDAADLVRREVKVIATPASTPAALAAKAATMTIPIVFATGADPVAIGLVGSLNHPGGNVTGIGFETVEITGKAFEVLHELLPKEMHITLLRYPNSVFAEPVMNKIQASAAALGVRFDLMEAGSDGEIEGAFAKIAKRSGAPIMLAPDAFYTSRRVQIVSLAARYAVPVMYVAREFTQAGGLISYGPDLANAYRETGTYTGRILKGEKPGDLPVVLPTKFDMVINLRTAKSLGIVVPDRLLALADQVIE